MVIVRLARKQGQTVFGAQGGYGVAAEEMADRMSRRYERGRS